jgi:hypothetical protein
MPMTPREVIRRNLERDHPPRIGMDFDGGRMNDFCFAGFSPSDNWQQKRRVEGEVEYFTDEWGNVWYRSVHGGQRGEVFQPALYGLERLAAKLRELNLCLYSPVDIQRVLPTGNRKLIEREAHRMVELFQGGFIAKNYPDLQGISLEPEWEEWAYQVFLKYARQDSVG